MPLALASKYDMILFTWLVNLSYKYLLTEMSKCIFYIINVLYYLRFSHLIQFLGKKLWITVTKIVSIHEN